MANPRRSKPHTTFNAASQARVEEAAQLAGMAEAFGQAAEMGPQVLLLQQALLRGMAQAQRQEAERLATRYGDGYERIADAKQRAERFEVMQAEWGERGHGLGRVVETFQRDGLFHGYVSLAEGAPAVNHVVRLEWTGTDQKRSKRGQAKTDAAGYFRIELGSGDADAGQGKDRLKRWAERFTAAAEPMEDKEPERPEAADDVNGTPSRPLSSVTVHEPGGAQVFDDPSPPSFEATHSEFRYYVVDGTPPGEGTRYRRTG